MNLLDKKMMGIVVAVLVIVGGGIFFYQQSCEQKEQAGKAALYEIQKTFEAESATLSEADKAAGAKLDVDAKFSKTIQQLNEMIQAKKVSDRVLYEASLKLGTMYLESASDANLPKAIDSLKKVTEFGKTNFQKASAFYLLGSAQERGNLLKDAADSYQKGSNLESDGLKGELLLALVRVNVKLSNATQAKAFADKLTKEAPGTRAAQEAQKLLQAPVATEASKS